MAGKLSLLVGFGAGYVLGARSGRERYERIMEKAQQVWCDPRVQKKARQAGHVVKHKAASAASSNDDESGVPGTSPSASGMKDGKLP